MMFILQIHLSWNFSAQNLIIQELSEMEIKEEPKLEPSFQQTSHKETKQKNKQKY